MMSLYLRTSSSIKVVQWLHTYNVRYSQTETVNQIYLYTCISIYVYLYTCIVTVSSPDGNDLEMGMRNERTSCCQLPIN
jgi:hypothetical protein